MKAEAVEVAGWPLFQGMSPGQVGVVLQACEQRLLVGDEVVMAEDQVGDSLFIVRSGRVEIFKSIRGGVDRVLESFVAGDVLGAMSFVDGSRLPAGARTTEASELIVLSRPAFERIGRERPEVAAAFYRNLAAVLGSHLRITVELYRQAVEFGIEATGASALSLGNLVEGLRSTTVHLAGGGSITGRLLQLDQNPAGFTLVVKDSAGRLAIVPYHAILRIDVA